MVSESFIANQGYPFQSTYSLNRQIYPKLTRASQVVRLSRRGDLSGPGRDPGTARCQGRS
jgi:hypothetical protein